LAVPDDARCSAVPRDGYAAEPSRLAAIKIMKDELVSGSLEHPEARDLVAILIGSVRDEVAQDCRTPIAGWKAPGGE
jgi:hypothetical protein